MWLRIDAMLMMSPELYISMDILRYRVKARIQRIVLMIRTDSGIIKSRFHCLLLFILVKMRITKTNPHVQIVILAKKKQT